MILCVCANVSEKDVIKLLPAEVEDVMMQTNCAMNCGQCFEALLELVEKNTTTVEAGLSSIRQPQFR